MIIGKFQQEDGVYVGSIPTFTASPAVRIVPTELTGIDYTVTIAGVGIDLGVAWKKTSAKGNEYLSVKLDSPFLPAAINCQGCSTLLDGLTESALQHGGAK